jgi:hypothetical protein
LFGRSSREAGSPQAAKIIATAIKPEKYHRNHHKESMEKILLLVFLAVTTIPMIRPVWPNFTNRFCADMGQKQSVHPIMLIKTVVYLAKNQ